MPRGRRRIPDEVKALKGNPGKRRLLSKSGGGPADSHSEAPKLRVDIPEFLAEERERTIFTRVVVDYLQRRLARPADLTAYARWAHYLHRWISCKEELAGKPTWFESESKHGKLLRRHPVFKDQLDLERVLQALEDRLGLNPVARQNILRGLTTLPPALGGLFDDPQPEAPRDPEKQDAPPSEPAPVSPVSFLQPSGKLN